jgi:hypothetical protein
MLIGYASHPAAQIFDTDQIGIRIRYDSDTYRICYMAYQIILFSLTSIQILTNKFGLDTFQIQIFDTIIYLAGIVHRR